MSDIELRAGETLVGHQTTALVARARRQRHRLEILSVSESCDVIIHQEFSSNA